MLTERKVFVLLHGVFKTDFFAQWPDSRNVRFAILEGRPHCDSARSSCLNLQKRGIVPMVLADNMAGYLFANGLVKEVWLAAQSVDGGGAMCQIGSLILAILAKKHHVPVCIAPTGKKVVKTVARASALKTFNGFNIVSGNVRAFVPLLEWIPAKYLRA